MRSCSLFFLCCLFAGSLYAQSVPQLLGQAKAYMGKDTNLALLHIERALDLTEAGSPEQDSAYYAMQTYYKAAPDAKHTYTEKSQAYGLLETHYLQRKDSTQLTSLYLQWADLEQEVDLGESEAKVSRAIGLAKQLDDKRSLADCHFRMGVIQGSMGNTDLVLQHFQKALQLAEALPDDARIVEAHTRIAEYYQRLGQFEEVAPHIEMALAKEKTAKPSTLINTYRIHGYLLADRGETTEAFQELERSILLAQESGDQVRLAMLQLDMAQLHLNYTQDTDAALDWLEKGKATAEAAGSLRFQRSAELGYFTIYDLMEQPEEALGHFQRFYTLEKQIANEKDRKQLMHFEAKYHSEQQEAELARQETALAQQKARQRMLTILLVSLVIVFIIVFVAFYNQRAAHRKLASQKAIIEEQAAELRALDTAKSRFFANISHELRTPLTLMLGPASSLSKRLPKDAPERSFLDMIRRNGEQLLHRVNEILDLSKLDAGQLEVVEEPVPVDAVIKRQIGMFESYAHQQEVNLSYDYSLAPGMYLRTDGGKLSKIIENLLSNAIKFTAAGGNVHLHALRQDEQLIINVKDNGRGVPEKDLAHIFERFYQSKHQDAPLEGGTGIGLAFSKELAEALGGDLRAESTYGEGSTFSLRLPFREMPEVAQEPSWAIEEPPGAAGNSIPVTLLGRPEEVVDITGQILVVEDNEELQRYIAAVLEPQYQVHRTSNGREALEWLEQRGTAGVDLILSDVMMPEVDGFALLQQVKSDGRFNRLPVIMLTALAQQESRLKALRIGVDDYLLKPFQEEELLARIQNLLTNYRLRTAALGAETEEQEEVEAHSASANKASAPAQGYQEDLDWIELLEATTRRQLSNSSYTVDDLAADMAVSRRQLYRKVKTLIGVTPNQYIQMARLQKARELIEQKRFSNVKRVAIEVGFKDARYFSKQYKAYFGRSPSGDL